METARTRQASDVGCGAAGDLVAHCPSRYFFPGAGAFAGFDLRQLGCAEGRLLAPEHRDLRVRGAFAGGTNEGH